MSRAPRPNRRQFLAGTGGVLASAAAGVGPLAAAAAGAAPPAPRARRLVVSTWNAGLSANPPAWEALCAGRGPLDAVEAGVRVTESDAANTSVGLGGAPNADGVVELDASIIRGDTRATGAVASLRNIEHPISVARLVMERTPHVLLAGEGALRFARAQGVPERELLTEESRRAWEAWKARRSGGALEPWERAPARGGATDHDTIGMVALDEGRLACAVTTSGLAYKLAGRVGDSPIVGAGSACDDLVGAVVSTGVGEEVIRVSGSTAILEGMRRGLAPRRAILELLGRLADLMRRADRVGQVAFLAVSRDGEVAGAALQPGFQYALTDAAGTRLVDAESLT